MNINDLLYESARNGFLFGVKYALENGVDVNFSNAFVLRIAVENGHLDVVRFLVENGANVCAYDNDAIQSAVENEQLGVAKYLVEKGANWKAVDRGGNNLMWYASKSENQEMIDYIQSLFDSENCGVKL